MSKRATLLNKHRLVPILKRIFILFLPAFFGGFVNLNLLVDNFKVVKVAGSIQIKKSGNLLSQGDIISSTETIIFKTEDARASVISKKNGRFVLSSQGKIEAPLKNNLIPAMNNISSRSGSILNLIDLQAYCKGKHVILDNVSMYISPKAFLLSDTSFFFAQYEYMGEKIDKKLLYKKDTLLINRDHLFTIDNVAVEIPQSAEVKIFYFSKGNAKWISDMYLVFPEKKQIKREVQTILEEMPSKSALEKSNEVISYLNEFYGKPDKENVMRWLKDNFAF